MYRYMNVMALNCMVVAAGLAAGCGGPVDVGARGAALTATDVDVAPECQGIIDYANTATYAELDAFLPSDTALNIVGARATAPFVSLADLMAVSGVAEYRLSQIETAARSASFIGTSCLGIYDQLAVSADDGAAMVSLVNTMSDDELHAILPNAWNGAVNLLATRPFTHVSQISATSGIGKVSLRSIRNTATLSRPFEILAAAVTGLHRETKILRHFDWWDALQNQGAYSLNGMTCFGIDPSYVPNGTVMRTNLADATEVVNEVQSAVNFGNRYHELTISPTAGMTNLAQQAAGKQFFGCYTSYANDPWSGNDQAFFVDKVSGFGVLVETWWSE